MNGEADNVSRSLPAAAAPFKLIFPDSSLKVVHHG